MVEQVSMHLRNKSVTSKDWVGGEMRMIVMEWEGRQVRLRLV